MRRRALLQLALSGMTAVTARLRVSAQSPSLTNADSDRIRVLADVVLPQEIGGDGRARAVNAFLSWVRDYRAGAETDHGYGFPRLRRTPPSPAAGYRAHLDALDAEARTRGGSFASLPLAERRAIVEAAIVAAKIERLPSRPDGRHIAADLLGFFFNSIEAEDLCYRRQIGRDTCRVLAGSEDRPSPLSTGGR